MNKMKEEASPEQVSFESLLDTMMEEFKTVFPLDDNGGWFELMYAIWNEHVQAELTEKYSNL